MATKNLTVIDESENSKAVEDENKTLDDNMKLLKNLRFQHIVDINMVRIFITVWLIATVLALLPMFREKYSDIEKRELQKFPEFSFKSLLSGDYFDGINLWFSDTFPLRDGFVSLNTKVKDTFGINKVELHGEIEQGDLIPDANQQPQTEPAETESEIEIQIPQDAVSDSASQSAPPEPAVEKLGAMLIVDNAAYEYYNFNRSVADSYTATVNRAAALLDGKSRVYDMIIPTSMAITLPENYSGSTNSSDQKKAIDYMYSRLSPNVSRVDTYTALLNRKNEYIFFRTDHH